MPATRVGRVGEWVDGLGWVGKWVGGVGEWVGWIVWFEGRCALEGCVCIY